MGETGQILASFHSQKLKQFRFEHYSVVSFQGNELMRLLNIAAFAVSGYASTEGRQCKPFNPLLGETYEADYPDKGLRFYSEKASQPTHLSPLLLQELYRNEIKCYI